MKWIQLLLWKIQSRHDFVHRQMDRQTDDVKSVYPPFNFVEAVGIIMREHCIGQTAWAAVIIMSWINMLRLEHYWGRVTHICLSKLTIIGSDNVLSPGRHQAIIRTNAGILLNGPLGTNFSEMLIKKKNHLFLHSCWNFHWNLFQMVQFICHNWLLNKRLSKQSSGWLFETLSRPLWRHCNGTTWTSPPRSQPTNHVDCGPEWHSVPTAKHRIPPVETLRDEINGSR